MKHFINLTSTVINKFHIVEIVKKPSKYFIHMSNTELNAINSKSNIIEICETKNTQDYRKIYDWINK